MTGVMDIEVCIVCGEEYWFEFDCRTGEYKKLSMCACDRFAYNATEFLKMKGLYDEFMKFHNEREGERYKNAE